MNNSKQPDPGLLAWNFVAEASEIMVAIATGLLASACAADPAAVQVNLWQLRRTLVTTITSCREVIPGFNNERSAR